MTSQLEHRAAVQATVSVRSFTKRDTNIVKGAAVIFLLTHHLYMGILPAPMSLFGNSPLLVFATLSKVCVAIFILLSGYGLATSYSHNKKSAIRFTVDHTLKLMKPFWLVYVVFFILSAFLARPLFTPEAVYDSGFRGLLAALIEFFGLRPLFQTGTLNQTWWYMEASLVLYLLFPLLYSVTKKLPWLSLSLTALPLVLYYFLGNNVWDTCREIYWFFPFTVGILAAQHGLFDRFSASNAKHPIRFGVLSLALLLIITLLRAKVGIAFDTFFAVSIILFLSATLCRIPYLSGAAAYVGKHAAFIFMTHSFFYTYFISQHFFVRFLWSTGKLIKLLALPLLLAMSLLASELLTRFIKLSAYDKLFPTEALFNRTKKE